jgi:two-component system, OmpR family, phosphate regulon sensor histidine kinase PhoR
MKAKGASRPLVLFYVLVVYVILQFSWWAYLLIRTNNQLAQSQAEILNERVGAAPDLVTTSLLLEKQRKLNSDLHKRWMMIVGEGAVFVVLLSWAIVRTRNGFKREALMAERQKNFLLSVTHELRSPLASIGLQAETLLKRDLPKEKQSQILTHVLEDTERLNALIGNILLAARIDNHSFSLQKNERNLSEFTEQLAKKIAAGVGNQHVFEYHIAPGIAISFDDVAAHSVFANLLENAVKYSPAGSVIEVALEKKSGTIIFSVADHGKGIPQTEKQTVFERFYRTGNEETRSTKGTGLGLYIARYLSQMHAWTIHLDDNKNGGSIFSVHIPAD